MARRDLGLRDFGSGSSSPVKRGASATDGLPSIAEGLCLARNFSQLDLNSRTYTSGSGMEAWCQGTKSLRDSPLRRALKWERGNQLREE
jgi:hypothetical protein